MDTKKVAKIIHEKVGLDEKTSNKIADAIKECSIAGKKGKEEIIKLVQEHGGVAEDIADDVYNAIAGDAMKNIADSVKGIFKKKSS